MPIGAAIGGAAITAGGTIAAGSMASSAQKKAANQAADSSLAVADKNNALYREIYGENKALLTPYSNNGLLASNALTDLLLGTHSFNGGALSTAAPDGTGVQTAPVVSKTPVGSASGLGALNVFADSSPAMVGLSPGERAARMGGEPMGMPTVGPQANGDHIATGGALAPYSTMDAGPVFGGGPQGNPTGVLSGAGSPAPSSAAAGAPSALSAWDQFRNGTNYNWRFNEGMRSVIGDYATRGALDSGAAEKAKITFGQNFASNELSNYMNLLSNQQAMGLSAASAVAGVGQGYAGNVAAQNTNAANAAANAALARGSAAASQWGSVGQGIGQLGGALYQYGMGQMMPRATYSPAQSGIVYTGGSAVANAGANWGSFG